MNELKREVMSRQSDYNYQADQTVAWAQGIAKSLRDQADRMDKLADDFSEGRIKVMEIAWAVNHINGTVYNLGLERAPLLAVELREAEMKLQKAEADLKEAEEG